MKRLANILASALVAALLVGGGAYAQSTVKNYFSPCGGVNCDNILNLTGTWKIGTTAVTSTAAEINALASAGVSAAEAAVLGGVTASAAEINALTSASLSAAEAAQLGLITKTGAQVNLLVEGVAGGYKLARGAATLDGSNPTTAATGLTTVVACTVEGPAAAAVPGDDPQGAVGFINTTNLDIYAWGTNGTDPTPVASTNNTAVFYWVCIGT